MTGDTTIQPIWVVAAHERMRLRISFAPELASLVRHGEQFITIRRTQETGNTPANGDFVQASAIMVAPDSGGLMIALHRKMWVNWRTPVEEPIVTFSRFYTTLFGLPRDLQAELLDQPRSVQLIQFEKFAHSI